MWLAAARRRACIQGSGKPAPYCITHGDPARKERVLAVGGLSGLRWLAVGGWPAYAPHMPLNRPRRNAADVPRAASLLIWAVFSRIADALERTADATSVSPTTT